MEAIVHTVDKVRQVIHKVPGVEDEDEDEDEDDSLVNGSIGSIHAE